MLRAQLAREQLEALKDVDLGDWHPDPRVTLETILSMAREILHRANDEGGNLVPPMWHGGLITALELEGLWIVVPWLGYVPLRRLHVQ